MSDNWDGMQKALVDVSDDKPHGSAAGSDAGAVDQPTPSVPAKTYTDQDIREHGWAEAKPYDYSRYKSGADAATGAATGGDAATESGVTDAIGGSDDGEGGDVEGSAFPEPEWESGAARYEWDNDYGDVGPRHPELEKILFGDDDHVRAGDALLHLNQIHVVQEGPIRVEPIFSFDDAGLHPVMRENVKLAGYDKPTIIQSYALPAIHLGHDIVACAQTGSGKTAAFFIPTLSKLMGKAKKLAAPRPNPATFDPAVDAPVVAQPLLLVVCPNRELAVQIFNEARRFCYRSMLRPCVIYGGGPRGEQIRQLQKGCDVLIGTPGRLCDFLERPDVMSLHRLRYMIIDEADELLNSDWSDELGKIMSGGDQQVGNITYMMFSATFPKVARDLAKEHLSQDYVRLRVGRAGSMHQNVVQNVVFTKPEMKRQCLIDLLMAMPPARTIIFVNAKHVADEIDDYLYNLGLPSTSLHGGRTQLEREDALRAFRKGEKPILVATGVSARGLDVHNVMHVINYDLPGAQYGGLEEYTHRIGRTARIGNLGLATSFYNERNEDLAEELTHFLQESNQNIPDFLQDYKAEEGIELKFEADSDSGASENGDAKSEAGSDGDVKSEPADDDAPAWGTADPEPAAEVPSIFGGGGSGGDGGGGGDW